MNFSFDDRQVVSEYFSILCLQCKCCIVQAFSQLSFLSKKDVASERHTLDIIVKLLLHVNRQEFNFMAYMNLSFEEIGQLSTSTSQFPGDPRVGLTLRGSSLCLSTHIPMRMVQRPACTARSIVNKENKQE